MASDCFLGGVYVYILDVRSGGPPCLFKSVLPVSFIWQRDGCLNQRSFCLYVEMWALTSARLGCLCFSPHLAPLPIFLIILFPASLSFLPPFQWRLNSSPMLFCLLTRPHFPVIFIPFLSLLVDQCIFFFPLLAPVFASSLLHSFQCSCQQKRPTRSCGGCAGPTFFWRK